MKLDNGQAIKWGKKGREKKQIINIQYFGFIFDQMNVQLVCVCAMNAQNAKLCLANERITKSTQHMMKWRNKKRNNHYNYDFEESLSLSFSLCFVFKRINQMRYYIWFGLVWFVVICWKWEKWKAAIEFMSVFVSHSHFIAERCYVDNCQYKQNVLLFTPFNERVERHREREKSNNIASFEM